jgi:hypothetical protein
VNVDTAFRLCYMDCVKLRARGTRMVTFWYFFSSAAMAMHLRNTMALMQNADSQIFVIIGESTGLNVTQETVCVYAYIKHFHSSPYPPIDPSNSSN